MRTIVASLFFLATNCFADASGVGSANVPWTAQPNLGPARSADIIFTDANGAVVGTSTVNQASGCGWLIAPQSANFAISGGSGAVAVTASDPACPAWTAHSNANWITVPPNSGATGNGMMTYSVAKNVGNTVARSGTITVAGQLFAVSQAGKK